jgi:hypothetical protein
VSAKQKWWLHILLQNDSRIFRELLHGLFNISRQILSSLLAFDGVWFCGCFSVQWYGFVAEAVGSGFREPRLVFEGK